MKSAIVLVLLGYACLNVSGQTNFPTQSILIRGDLTLNNPGTASNFKCPTMNVETAFNGQNVTCAAISGKSATVQTLNVGSIIGQNGELIIDSNMAVFSSGQAEQVIANTISSNSQNLWLLASHESFERLDLIQSWSNARVSNCATSNMGTTTSNFLGGPCLLAEKEIAKNFENLPTHNFLRVKAKFHMFDNWEGEFGYLKLDQETVWTHAGVQSKDGKGINICGGESPDPAFNLAIDVTVPHSDNNILLTFGSTLTKDPCHASYGVDDVELYVK